jgi:protoporphyrinogen oxidase
MRAVVLGGGIAGLSAGIALQQGGAQTTILEGAPGPGGLASGFRDAGYTFDYFSHRLWTRDPEVLALTQDWIGEPLLVRRKVSRILLDGRLYNYPIDLRDLLNGRSTSLALRALAGYAAARLGGAAGGDDFKSHLTARYGRAIFDTFFGPYTEKLTGCPTSEIAVDLAQGAIPGNGLVTQLLHRLTGRADPWDDLYYPAAGFMAIPEGMARAFRSAGGLLLLSHRVARVRRAGSRVVEVEAESGGGRLTIAADLLVSTVPLATLLGALDPPAPSAAVEASARLRTRAMVAVYLGVRRENLTHDHWIYVPDPGIRFNRLSETTNYSPRMAPAGRTGLCAEIACDEGDEVWREDDARQAARVIDDLVRTRFLGSASEVERTWVKRFRNAYPVYRVGYQEHLSEIDAFLGTIDNLKICGRQGAFWYGSTAQGIRQGLDLARGLGGSVARAA